MSAAELKAQGNEAFTAKEFPKAIEIFTKAIEVDSQNHVLYSNRSACEASLKQFDKALEDAEKCIELKSDWAKGYSRKATALHGQGKLEEACEAYEKALEIEPSNVQAKAGLDTVGEQMRREMQSGNFGGPGGQDPFGQFTQKLNDPAFIKKMAENPQTSKLLGDADFMRKLEKVKANPSSLMQEMNDPRMISILGLLLGQDIGTSPQEDDDMPDLSNSGAESKPAPKKAPAPARPATPEPEPMEEDEDVKTVRLAKEQADTEKTKGTAAYKSRDFENAIKHYQAAWDLHKDIAYMTNLAAAQYEAGDFNKAIEACEMAIEQGREVRADFKIIAKAFARIGSAYEKKGELDLAITNYQKALTEHRTPDILKKLKDAEKAKVEALKTAYVNPEKADEAREAGNVAFKKGDFPVAVKQYTEVTKRAPNDPRGYANRAAAYIKLMSMPEAIKDCDQALALDSKFVKAYIRKAAALTAMKDYNKAIDVLSAASAADTNGTHTSEIQQNLYKIQSAQADQRNSETADQTEARIQSDPEIMGILQDPVMQSILGQARDNPASLQDHLKNPQVAAKIHKLINAGVIRTR